MAHPSTPRRTASFARLDTTLRPVIALLMSVLTVSASAASVGIEVHQALQSADLVPVVVELDGSAAADENGRARIAARQDDVLATLPAGSFRESVRWAALPGFAGEVTRAGLAALAEHPGVLRVDLDVSGGGSLTESSPLVGAPSVHALGYTGEGIVVAVVDSGVRSAHPDLSGSVIAEQCFCSAGFGSGCCPNGLSSQSGAGSAVDDNGHGTNVAGIIASRGVAGPKGIAPGTSIVAVKVLDSQNRFISTGQVLSGLDWIIANRPDVRVVNMSLGTDARFSGTCDGSASYTSLFATAIGTLRSRGTATFVSAGNDASANTMQAPACVGSAIAMGAVYDANVGSSSFGSCLDSTTAADQVVCFSNASSALDLLAPGSRVTSSGLNSTTSTYSGTSQASPHAAAGAALLFDKLSGLTVDEVESAMKETGKKITDTRSGSVFPRIDLAAAIASVGSGGGCANSESVVCIGNRFEVSVDFATSQNGGMSGKGHAASTAPIGFARGGLFWFFDPGNPEMLVKVLDGCLHNNRYWFFASAGTNVGYTIRVTDTVASVTKTWTNVDLQPAQPIQDTGAFATCP